jgi:hypothetical protein
MHWKPEDIITTDKYLAAFPNYYWKTDVFYSNRPILWRGRVQTLPPKGVPLVLCGHSDYPLTDEIVQHYPMTKLLSVNKQSRRVSGLPLGITNNTRESELHPVYGNVDVMVDAANTARDIQNLVYMNFAVHTYPTERVAVWTMFKDKTWVTVEGPENSMEGRKRFLQSARNHSFVLCPRGNGVDTHRLWETLYMGSIPIVRKDIAHSDWEDLPILFVDSWDEVTEQQLRNELVRIQNTQWNMDKLFIGYWLQHIRNESGNGARSH